MFEVGIYWCCCSSQGEGDFERVWWFQLAHTRYASPQLDICAPAQLDAESCILQKSDFVRGFNYLMGITCFGLLFKSALPDHSLERVFLAPAPVHDAVACLDRGDQVSLQSDF